MKPLPEKAPTPENPRQTLRAESACPRIKSDTAELAGLDEAKILRAILARRAEPAKLMLRSHIEASKAAVRKITLHSARPQTQVV